MSVLRYMHDPVVTSRSRGRVGERNTERGAWSTTKWTK